MVKNAIGQELNVGDVVAYVTRTKNPETRLGVISRFELTYTYRWDAKTQRNVKTDAYYPVIYSWNRWRKNGYGAALCSCEHVFPAPHITLDEAKAMMLRA